MKIKLLTLLPIIIFSSCCHELNCSTSSVQQFGLVSFTSSDLDTIIIKRFSQGSNFRTLIDSMVLLSTNSNPYVIGDTTLLSITNSSAFSVKPGYDFKVLIPSTNELLQINNIVEKQTEQKVCCCSEYPTPKSCVNPLISYTINGKQYNNENSYPIIYITK